MNRRALLASLMACGANAEPAPKLPLKIAEAGFYIRLPEGAELKQEPRQADFDIYRVSMNGEKVVGIYVGNHPNLEGVDKRKITKYPFVRTRDSGAVEYLLRTRCRFPSRIHVWVYDVKKDDALAKAIAKSVKPGKCPKW